MIVTRTFDWGNQYVSRTVPGYVDVQGEAASAAMLTVNNQATYRNGTFYRGELPVGNGTSAVWFGVTNVAVLTDPGNPDIVTTEEGNVLVPKSPQNFSHDADGNLTADGRWLWSWNGENRLVQLVTHPLAESAGKPRQKLEFAYDAQGRRISKVVYSWSGSAWVEDDEARLSYDGWNLLAELDDSLDATKTFTRGLDLSGSEQGAGGVGGLLFEGLGATGVHFVAFDGNGNVGALADEAAGAVTAKYEYSLFGKVCLETGTAVAANPIKFSTKYEDAETRLLGYGYRYYDPDTGRWPNRDPIEERGGENCFAFLSNKSINFIDYLGMANAYEVAWAITHPCCALRFSGIKSTMEEFMERQYGKKGNQDDTRENAIKHCTWMCYMASSKFCGKSGAFGLGLAHERGDPNNTANRQNMDMRNNLSGIFISQRGMSLDDCHSGCAKLADEGKLTIISK